DETIVERRAEIIAGLAELVEPPGLITSPTQMRVYETDALTAYRPLPLAVGLPGTTEEAHRVLAYCHAHKVKVVARGAGTSLAGGAIAHADAIILGASRMNRVLEVDYPNRCMRVEAGITNLAITNAVSADGFFYAPDPSSQLACTIAG